MISDRITLTIRVSGERTIDVDRAAFEETFTSFRFGSA